MQGQIKVIFTEGQGKESGNNRTAINTRTGKAKSKNQVQEHLKANNIVNHAYKNYVVGQAKKIGSVVLSEVLYEINKYFDLTDNVEGKRDLHIAMGMINRVKNFAGQVVAGSYFGVPGAVIGFASASINEAISIYQGYDQQNIQIRQMNTQLEYTRERAGYSLTSGSIGENK